ncbi:hypothetical protein [Porphyromonas gulae]|uniref:Uncharacterized protein n=1 Tax=Porphyromonas gulae TaxID=111105 RepID=A0A0A2FAH9_9PORP|nr:hypothetical protein [Porphyromonas gulae]KGN87993.1 hypothetical protein HR08_00970 [Porphyromonas gulae]
MSEEKKGLIEEPKPSRREAFIASMKERLGDGASDVDWDDEDARYGAYSDEFDRLNGELSGFKESDEALRKAIGEDPRFGDVVAEIAGGGKADLAFIRAYGKVLVEMMADENRTADVEEANKGYLEKLQKFEAATHMDEVREELFEQNADAIDAFCQEKGLDGDGFQEFCKSLFEFCGAVYMGNLDKETLEKGWNLVHYDENLSAAKDAGITEGRNAQLEAVRTKRQGDGLPNLTGLGGGVPRQRRKSPMRGGSMWDDDYERKEL